LKKNKGRRPPSIPRRDPKPYFEVGRRVVCVDASPSPLAPDLKPLLGKIYVIRAIDIDREWKWPHWGVHVAGVRIYCPDDDTVEWPFHPRRFRPITERSFLSARADPIRSLWQSHQPQPEM
jgi:hypothetical protein